jgi:thioredoxin-like negative regulator of GroEL
MIKRILIFVLVLAAGCGLGVPGIRMWRKHVAARQERVAYESAKAKIQAGHPEEALGIIRARNKGGNSREWKELELTAVTARRDFARLERLYESDREMVLKSEDSSLWLSRSLLSHRKTNEFAQVRQQWKGHETETGAWLALDADALIAAGKRIEAEKFLRSKEYKGDTEATRLTRLALVIGNRNLPEAWSLINKASQINPKDSDIRSFRAQILEAVGQTESARVDYVAALVSSPENPLLRDQLAEFYQRLGNYDLALQTWREALAKPTFDYMWVKAAFWGKVIQPKTVDSSAISEGELQPLAQWILGLKAEEFWNSTSFGDLTRGRRYLAEREELFWLQVIDLLQHQKESDALQLVTYNKFRARSWQPDLETALARILTYRQKRSLQISDAHYIPSVPSTNAHQLYLRLDEAARAEKAPGKTKIPADLDILLKGPNAFAAAFMAAGWREAAIQLYVAKEPASSRPDWFNYGYAQCLRSNRGAKAALEFLNAQTPASVLTLLAGEIEIEAKHAAEGVRRLASIAGENTSAGTRASYLLALASLDQGKPDEAERWVQQQSNLLHSVLGREITARIASARGNSNEVERIYRGIATNSIEARVYLAKKAFAAKNYPEAKRYTLELMTLMPDALTLRENLDLIAKAEAGR